MRAARELKADLIVLATHGYTGYKRMFLGSTAERVVQHSPCPVLVVRHRLNRWNGSVIRVPAPGSNLEDSCADRFFQIFENRV